jgi:hypothetical protein
MLNYIVQPTEKKFKPLKRECDGGEGPFETGKRDLGLLAGEGQGMGIGDGVGDITCEIPK